MLLYKREMVIFQTVDCLALSTVFNIVSVVHNQGIVTYMIYLVQWLRKVHYGIL